MRPKAESVDQYLAEIESEAARKTLTTLRAIIRDEIPDAEECISYGIPTYKHFGMVCSFAAFKKHCSFFPGHTVRDFAEELAGYKVSTGTIQFPQDELLPEPLVRAIVQARYKENEAEAALKKPNA